MRLPTAREINPVPENLDGKCAERNFLGKTLEEAEALFRENSLNYQEDLMFMGVVAFRFYVRAAIRFLESDAANADSDMVNCFASILEFRIGNERDELRAVAGELAESCEYVVTNFGKFDVDAEIYGDLRERFAKLAEEFVRLKLSRE
jgi:hypothetical protein